MRIVTYESSRGPRSGALRAAGQNTTELIDLGDANLPASVKRLLEEGGSALARAADAVETAPAIDPPAPRLLAPVIDPQKIIGVGLNYADHAAETGAQVGDEPVIFCKFPTALRGPGDPIVLPPESERVDFEAELVVVIGKPAHRIARSQALEYVAGYCCGNDVSARDWQKGKPGGQWLLGKSFDSFAPLGPWIATPDEIADPGDLRIQLRLNGQVMQDSCTKQLIFPVDYLVSYLSHVCTLLPGDLIFTGTPPGVGAARKPPQFLQPGDEVEIEIERLGVLRNSVVAGG